MKTNYQHITVNEEFGEMRCTICVGNSAPKVLTYGSRFSYGKLNQNPKRDTGAELCGTDRFFYEVSFENTKK